MRGQAPEKRLGRDPKRRETRARQQPDIAAALPEQLRSEAELEEFLARPSPSLVGFIRKITGPLLVLGAGGKMGPTLAVLAKRAAETAGHRLEIVAVSRFSDDASRRWLEKRGVATIRADLLQRQDLEKLPDTREIIYLVGLKFGTQQNPALTWAVNTLAPAHVLERYPKARLVALSTGNVYPLVSTRGRGAEETWPLSPLGEYANAAIARERLFEYFSRRNRTRVALLRLNYAVELRYGVLADIAQRVLAGTPINLANGCFNCIWQGDANEMILRALALATSPAESWNLTSSTSYRVRDIAVRFGELLGRSPRFKARECQTAFLSDSAKLCAALGQPATPLDAMIRWTACWVQSGGRSLAKPTHFEIRDGQY